jgi:hypothetical protein
MTIRELKDFLDTIVDQDSEINFNANTDAQSLLRWNLISVGSAVEEDRVALTFTLESQ